MEEAPENGKESPHSAHANGMNESASLSSPATLRIWVVTRCVSLSTVFLLAFQH